MANREQLSILHKNMILNLISKNEDKVIKQAFKKVALKLNYKLDWTSTIALVEVVSKLKNNDFDFSNEVDQNWSVKPDGGVLSLIDDKGKLYPICIGEMKHQGTNEIRVNNGLKQQARGNAIETNNQKINII